MKSGCQGGGRVRGLKRAEKSACFPDNLSVRVEQGPLKGRHVGRGRAEAVAPSVCGHQPLAVSPGEATQPSTSKAQEAPVPSQGGSARGGA